MAELTTVEITDVEVLSVGKWNGIDFTLKRLRDMVVAHKETVGELDPPVKLGHDDDQELLQADGFPAAGWVRNLRLIGKKLIADFTKVPKKVADLIETGAFRKRSSEIMFDVKVGGTTYPTILTGVALLGEDFPAVESLEDIVELYQALSLDLDEGTHVVMTTLAVWSRAFINALPNSAFAIVEKGGALDSEGRSVPRQLRHLPHHDDKGAVDVAHLRNSLSRLPTTPVPSTLKQSGLSHLQRHARSKGVGEAALEALELATQLIEKEGVMEKELRELLGLKEDGDLVATITALRDGAAGVATELGLKDDQDAVTVIKELRMKKPAEPDPKKGGEGDDESTAQITQLTQDLAAATTKITTIEEAGVLQQAESQVDADLKGGRILPRQREVALKLALSSNADYKAFIDSQPTNLVDLSEHGTATDDEVTSLEPTEEEVKLAKNLGTWSPAMRIQLIKTKAAERGVSLPVDFGQEKEEKK